MKRIWITLLLIGVIAALLAMPGTAVAKPGQGKPPTTATTMASTPNLCPDGSFPLIVGEATFDCARLTDLGGIWTFMLTTSTGETERVGSLVTQLRTSIPGDRCNGPLKLYLPGDTSPAFDGTGSGFSFRYIESGTYYTLDTSEMDPHCVVFSVDLKKAIDDPITINATFRPNDQS